MHKGGLLEDPSAMISMVEHMTPSPEQEDLSRAGIESIDFFNTRIDNIDLNQALRAVTVRIAQRKPGYIVTPNVDHVCRVQRDPEFCLAYHDAFLSLADGMPILWAAKLFRTPFRQKLSGSDMVEHLSALAARAGFSMFLFGGAEGVAEEAARRLKQRHPALEIAGTYSPPFRFEADRAENAKAVQELQKAAPDICLVALSPPRQELWMWHNHRKAGVPVMIGIGGSLNFVVGRTRRAPRILQKAGLEWLWRLCMEPRRLWRRYLVYDMLFFALMWRGIVARCKSRLPNVSPRR